MNLFHLSLPVSNRQHTRDFYCNLLGGRFEKEEGQWFNIRLQGHQLTFHVLPDKVLASPFFHWGLNVDWNSFHALFNCLNEQNIKFELLPAYENPGMPNERVKMMFYDPDNYLLEYKAYKN